MLVTPRVPIPNRRILAKNGLLVLFVLFAIVIFQSASSKASHTDKVKEPRLVSIACWFEVGADWPQTSCFNMFVPQNHTVASGRQIMFPVVLFSAESKDKHKTPVLHLGAGGPGRTMGFHDNEMARRAWQWYKELSLARGRDLYVIDPRGVGMAEPRLNCTEFKALNLDAVSLPASHERYADKLLEAEQACKQRLERSGVDVSQYNSLAVARDIELLRQELGIEKWNLYGISYATRYALTITREFPDTVAAMVLDSTVFPNTKYRSERMLNLRLVYKRLFEYCKSYRRCSYGFDNMDNRYWSLLRELDKNPLKVTIDEVNQYGPLDIYLTGYMLERVVLAGLYEPEIYDEFSDIVTQLEQRNAEPIKERIISWLFGLLDSYHGDASQIGHFCHEEFPFIQDEEELALLSLTQRERESYEKAVSFAKKECALWGISVAGEVENQPVVTPIPTLFLHGALDPVLPASELKPQMKYFKNYAYIIFDDYAHDIVSTEICAEKVSGAFFDYHLDYNYEEGCLRQ